MYLRAFVLLVLPAAVAAQDLPQPAKKITYITEASKAADAAAALEAEVANKLAFYNYPVGKTYWLMPGGSMSAAFYEFAKRDAGYVESVALQGKFTPATTVSFKVTQLVEARKENGFGPRYLYRVVIEDGKHALMDAAEFGRYVPGTAPDAPREKLTDRPEHAASSSNTRLFTADPALLLAAYKIEQENKARAEQHALAAAAEATRKEEAAKRAQRAKAARDFQRRGGVRIGMTPQQVRASTWGAPSSVNRSTGSFGVHEQWVYGGNNYLYFENGILSSIQN